MVEDILWKKNIFSPLLTINQLNISEFYQVQPFALRDGGAINPMTKSQQNLAPAIFIFPVKINLNTEDNGGNDTEQGNPK